MEFPVDETTNRYLGGEDDMVYDAAGNLIEVGEGAWQMRWDVFDMQVQFTSTTPVTDSLYAYGPGDYRLITLDTESNQITWHLRDLDGTILREYTLTGSGAPEFWSTWTHNKDFIHGPDGLIATSTRNNTRHFFHADHLGTPRAISDALGIRRGQHDYYAFGGEVPRTGQVDEPMAKFTGHQRDAHGLSDYMLGRTCLWPLRRFASVDPARDGWNLYSYVGNNPVKYVDPDGLLRVEQETKNRYPKAAAFIEGMGLRFRRKERRAFRDHGGASRREISNAFNNGQGSEVKGSNLGQRGNGVYRPNAPDTLEINNNILDAFEQDKPGSTAFLESTVKHELTHYFDAQDGIDTPGEEGEKFEIDVYGMDVDNLQQGVQVEEANPQKF